MWFCGHWRNGCRRKYVPWGRTPYTCAPFALVGFSPFWLVKDGDVGDNRYGEDPKVVSDDEMRGLSIRKDEIEKMGGDSVI